MMYRSLKLPMIVMMMMPLMIFSRIPASIFRPPFNFTWPTKKASDVEGDITLGGLMMIHERQENFTCGPVMPQGGIQALETMLYTIDQINPILFSTAGFTIGAHILDDCDKDTYGLEQAVAFIKGSINNIDDTEYKCLDGTVPDVRNKVISGVVGASSSGTSIQVANLLRLFKIPQVSFFSSSPELSNKQRFEYFTRTIPSDHHQVMAIVQMIRFLKWSYISILYEESTYGIKAFEELEVLLAKNNICIAVKERLVKDSGVAGEAAYNGIVHKLNSKPKAKGVIIFGSDQEVSGVMRAVRRNNLTANFNWIGSDGWAGRLLVSEGNEPEVEGTLAFLPQAHPVRGFDNYFLSLTPQNNKRNPWFIANNNASRGITPIEPLGQTKFWENHFQCRYPSSSPTPYNQDWHRMCTGREKLTPESVEFEGQLQYVSDAVLAFAYAFKDMHQTLCYGRKGLCKEMLPIDGSELLKYLRKVEFTGLSGDRFQFDDYGDGPARYDLIHFKQVSPGRYRRLRIGEYHSGQLKLDTNELRFRGDQTTLPESICSRPCNASQAKKYVEGEGCCWTCVECVLYQIRNPDDETQCSACPLGTLPNVERSQCLAIPEVYLRPDSGWAIGAMSFSAMGIVLTFTVLGVFLRHNDTPVVRASGRELSYVLLSGILLCYMVSFLFVLRPTDVVCGVQQTAIGLCFSVVYAALFTKTNRIARIFRGGKKSAGRPGLISPKSQLAICGGLVAVQGLILLAWLWVSPSVAKHVHPTREDNLLVCSSFTDASYMMAFAYPILLILLCTVYAVVTRKIPAAFNESKYIGFTMYTTCVIWLAFVPIYFSTASHLPLRITSMSVTISLSATVTLACLFSPKLYIIIFHPERNIRQALTVPSAKASIQKSSGPCTNNGHLLNNGKNNQVNENGVVEKNGVYGDELSNVAYDIVNTTSHGSLNGSFPIEMDLFRSTCHILLVTTGVPLNLFIAVIIIIFKRLHNKPRNVLWLGVTFFNLLTLVTILIEFMAFHTQNNVVCLVFVSITGVAYTSILFNLFLALIDRYTAIVHPIWHRQNVTVRWVIIGQLIGFFFIVFVIKFPFIAQFAPPYCGYYPVHAKLIAVTNMLLFISCIVAQMVVYFKIRQYFNSSRQRGDGSEAPVTFVLSVIRQNPLTNNNSSGSNSQSRLPSDPAVNSNNPWAVDRPDSSSLAAAGQMMLRRHQHIGGNRQMELEATWSLLSGVFSLLLFTFPTLLVAFIEWGCRMIYGQGFCPPLIGVIMFYARELLLGHLVYNPVMYMVRNREFSSTVREKIRFR